MVPAHRVGMALHQGVVALVDRALLEGALERGVRPLALGDDHQPAGADVEAVHDALPLGGAGGRDAVARRGQAADDRRAGPARRSGARRRRPACRRRRCRRRRGRSRMPGHRLGDQHGRSRRRPGSVTSSHAPATTRSDLPTERWSSGHARRRRRGRRPWCGRGRTAGRARRRRARPRARPGRAGTRTSAMRCAPSGRPCLGVVAAAARLPRRRRCRAARGSAISTAAEHDGRVGEVEDRPVRQLQEVHDVPAAGPGRRAPSGR